MKVYCSHSIRGKHGKDATASQMKENCDSMIRLSKQLRRKLSCIDFYVPAEHEEFVQTAYNHGYLDEEQILAIDCLIIDQCDAVIVYVPQGDELQGGRLIEYQHAVAQNIPVCIYREPSEAVDWLTHQQMR